MEINKVRLTLMVGLFLGGMIGKGALVKADVSSLIKMWEGKSHDTTNTKMSLNKAPSRPIPQILIKANDIQKRKKTIPAMQMIKETPVSQIDQRAHKPLTRPDAIIEIRKIVNNVQQAPRANDCKLNVTRRSQSEPILKNWGQRKKSMNSIPQKQILPLEHPLSASLHFQKAQHLMQRYANKGVANPYRKGTNLERSGQGISLALEIKAKGITKGLRPNSSEYWQKMGEFFAKETGSPITCDQSSAITIYELISSPAFKEATIEVVALGNPQTNGHFIVVVDRDAAGDINDTTTWGSKAFVIDIWDAVQFPEDRNIVTAVENFQNPDFKNEKGNLPKKVIARIR